MLNSFMNRLIGLFVGRSMVQGLLLQHLSDLRNLSNTVTFSVIGDQDFSMNFGGHNSAHNTYLTFPITLKYMHSLFPILHFPIGSDLNLSLISLQTMPPITLYVTHTSAFSLQHVKFVLTLGSLYYLLPLSGTLLPYILTWLVPFSQARLFVYCVFIFNNKDIT